MAFTFKKTLENVEIGKSLFDEDGSKKVAEIVAKAKAKGVELVFPVDYVAAEKFAKDSKASLFSPFAWANGANVIFRLRLSPMLKECPLDGWG